MSDTPSRPTDQDIARRTLFVRYARLLLADANSSARSVQDPHMRANLHEMCRAGAADAATMDPGRANRWLGFVQGALAAHGVIDMNTENARTGDAFGHAASDIAAPAPARGTDRRGAVPVGPAPRHRVPSDTAPDPRAAVPAGTRGDPGTG